MSPGGASTPGPAQNESTGFRHQALFYSGPSEFLDRVVAFVNEGIEADEPTLVAIPAPKEEAIRTQLGSKADRVQFVDMTKLGHNPAHIIPAWRRFVDAHAGRAGLRGIGEPIWAGRRRAEVVEAQGHESLLNLALADADLSLLCPYDVDVLEPPVIEEARRSHPTLVDTSGRRQSWTFRDASSLATAPFSGSLPEPYRSRELVFRVGSLAPVRRFVSEAGGEANLDTTQVDQLVLAVNEVVTNTLRYAGGIGLLRVWREQDVLICEVRDRGQLDQPMVGRERPAVDQESGRGLWMANQLCDLVQIRSLASGTIVRLHVQGRAHE